MSPLIFATSTNWAPYSELVHCNWYAFTLLIINTLITSYYCFFPMLSNFLEVMQIRNVGLFVSTVAVLLESLSLKRWFMCRWCVKSRAFQATMLNSYQLLKLWGRTCGHTRDADFNGTVLNHLKEDKFVMINSLFLAKIFSWVRSKCQIYKYTEITMGNCSSQTVPPHWLQVLKVLVTLPF